MNDPLNVLVIGCGNIGAQYDLGSNDIKTHVKAWSTYSNVLLTVFDINENLVREISERYNCRVLDSICSDSFQMFDCVSICTPTSTHFNLLELAFRSQVKTIICEKPVSNTIGELEKLLSGYQTGHSKVLVNYMRRFQPSFMKLKEVINSIVSGGDEITNISIRYQRGFVNNCSHAFDLIEFLLDKEISLNNYKVNNKIFDQFDSDPTLSLNGAWETVNFSVLGLGNVLFSHFEIDLYFKTHKVAIKNAGDIIEVYETTYNQRALNPLIKVIETKDCLKNYMKFVTDFALQLIDGSTTSDNFVSATNLNIKMLNYLDN